MLTLGAWASHPSVHLAQIKMGKGISKGRANTSRATSQIKSGCIDSIPWCLLHKKGPVISRRSSHLKLSTWTIKEICSLWKEICYETISGEADSVFYKPQEVVAIGYLSWMCVGLAPVPILVLRVCWNGSNTQNKKWGFSSLAVVATGRGRECCIYGCLRERCKAATRPCLPVVRLYTILLRGTYSQYCQVLSAHRSRVCATQQSWDVRAALLSASLHVLFCSHEPWRTFYVHCRAKESVQPHVSGSIVS